ncbi:MAG: type IV pilus modification protein PilV [Zoogloeaceae bacterium]|jgi:type IV pilus modification protein PilV|nr:type IV pilus modification protein PilV [Zoogloeaceae bacterium]
MRQERRNKRSGIQQGQSRARGTTLIEVLVAMFVLMLGLLGVAGLQIVATKSSRSALARSVATGYVNEMFDILRNNPGVILGDAADPKTVFTTTACSEDAATAPLPAAPTPCDQTKDWQRRLKAELPSGLGKVVFVQKTDANNRPYLPNTADEVAFYTVTVEWTQKDADKTGLFESEKQSIKITGQVL